MVNDNQQEPPSIGDGWRVKEKKGGFRKKTGVPDKWPNHVRTGSAKRLPQPVIYQSQTDIDVKTNGLTSISYRYAVLALVGLAIFITSSFLLWGGPDEKEVITSLEPATPSELDIITNIEREIALTELELSRSNTDESSIIAVFDKERDLTSASGMGGPIGEEPIQTTRSLSPAPAASPIIEIAAVALDPLPQPATTETAPVYRVQVGALPTRVGAARLWNQSLLDHNELISGIQSHVEAATTANGEIFRLQLGSFQNRGEANDLCTELKKRDASCFVVAR